MTDKKFNPADYEKILSKDDFWRVQIKNKTTGQLQEVGKPIISHDGVKKLAEYFGVTVHKYEWLKQSLDDCFVMIEVTGFKSEITPEVGECNGSNAGTIGKNYPHSMAWKRGYDRAVLMHLGIVAYSEEEAEDFKRNFSSNKQHGQSEEGEHKGPSVKQKNLINSLFLGKKLNPEQQISLLKENFKKDSLDKLSIAEASKLIETLKAS